MSTASIRPTKKQRELLSFIEKFIGEHGYSPSYREIMNGLNYTSVATVSLHVTSLIRRGHLRKRDRSARSLEVVAAADKPFETIHATASQEKWFIDKVESLFREAETTTQVSQATVDDLYVLVSALKVLGLPEAANSFVPRLKDIGSKVTVEVAP